MSIPVAPEHRERGLRWIARIRRQQYTGIEQRQAVDRALATTKAVSR